MTAKPNHPAIAAPAPQLSFTALSDHLQSDQSFLSCYARTLAAIALANKLPTLSDFAALMDVARNAQYAALMGMMILHALEHGTELDKALADLSKAHGQSDAKECEAAFLMAKPLLLLQGYQARALAKRLAAALKVALAPEELLAMPQDENAPGLLNKLSTKTRQLVKGKDVTDHLVEFGKSIGDPEMIGHARACQSGAVSRQELGSHFALVTGRMARDIGDFRANALRTAHAAGPLADGLTHAAQELQRQAEQRLAIIAARIRYERAAFAEDIDDLVHDAGNAIENSIADRLHSDKWKDKDVWASIARTQFGKEAERRIERAVRRREEVLGLFKEELKLFQSDLRVVQASILSRQHHAELAQLMPPLRLGTRIVNAMDSAANMTLGTGAVAVAGTGVVYLLGATAVLPLVAPVAPFLVGALAAAGLFKWFTDNDKRKIDEIASKRRVIEEVVRGRLSEAAASFNNQLAQLENDYRQSAFVLLNPIFLDAEAARQVQALHHRVAANIIDQSEAAMKTLAIALQ